MPEAPLLPGFRLDSTFFGFEPKDRPDLHDRLFELLWAGEGRWDWNTIYNMPIFLRNFWIRKLNKLHDIKKQANIKAKQNNIPPKVIKPPM
tara:strand:- start:936 stop:1208 length:273 start_codon:yes stop_codon:yes gene_type:complete